METTKPPDTTSPPQSVDRRNWVLPIVGLVVIVAGTWWFGIRDAGSDPADVIQGTWYWAEYDAYETFDGDGEWSVREGLEGGTFDWGTYTF